jgi:predicted DNA-binding transcriptional regulator AlpA
MGEKMLTTAEVAQKLEVSVRTLEHWRQRRVGPEYVRMGKRMIRYPAMALDDYIARGGEQTTSTKDPKQA